MDETTRAFRAAQRAPQNLVIYTGVGLLLCSLPQVPGMQTLLGLTSGTLAWWVGACLLATAIATVLYRTIGETATLYRVVAVTEACLLQVGAASVITSSGRPASPLWLITIAFASLQAGITEARLLLGALVVVPPIGAAVVFASRGDLAGALVCLLVDALALMVFVATSRAHLRREEAMAQLVRWRLEEDRRRIARDLHDGTAADLAAVVWKAESLLQRLPSDPARRAELEQLAARASEGIDDLRAIVWSLRQEDRTWAGLVACVRQRCTEATSGRLAVVVEAVDEDSPRPVPGSACIDVLRFVQEAVRNVIRHAAASRVHVRLAWPSVIEVSVEDDGRGLPEGAELASSGGLRNFQRRAQACGGTSRVERLPQGTRVSFTVPTHEHG